MTRAHANAFHLICGKKKPHDGTHHAALKLSLITCFDFCLFTSYFWLSYASPIVASVGSSIADVTAKPLSAW
jgi:hypothetical protein